jgi:hypothetical protein
MRYKVSGVSLSTKLEVVILIEAPGADAAMLEGLRRGLEVRTVSAEGRSPRARWAGPPSIKPGGKRRR